MNLTFLDFKHHSRRDLTIECMWYLRSLPIFQIWSKLDCVCVWSTESFLEVFTMVALATSCAYTLDTEGMVTFVSGCRQFLTQHGVRTVRVLSIDAAIHESMNIHSDKLWAFLLSLARKGRLRAPLLGNSLLLRGKWLATSIALHRGSVVLEHPAMPYEPFKTIHLENGSGFAVGS